jgi:hypothetical protein
MPNSNKLTPLSRIKSHLPFANIIRRFNVYGCVHRKYIQQDAAHAGHQGNELADQLAKEAASISDNECYNRITKSAVKSELKGNSVKKWQTEWDCST